MTTSVSSTTHPLFSVLIANYNNGQYLLNAIDSIVEQTYPNWEIVIVDDKSTDNSIEIYKKYANDSRFKIHFNESNMGCGSSKRRCVELATGDICGFLDPDDGLTRDALETMISAHTANPNCSLVYSLMYYADSNLTITNTSTHQCKIPPGHSFLTCNIPGAVSHFATFKKTFYLQTPGLNPAMKRAVDTDLYLKLEEVGKLQFVEKPLYIYRCNTGHNISLGDVNAQKAIYWNFLARTEACQRRGLPTEDIAFPLLDRFILDIKENAFIQGEDTIRRTKAYSLGKRILRPFSWIKSHV